MLVLCALGAGIFAATYGLTHQSVPEASQRAAQTAGIAAPKDGKEITGTAITDPTINEQAARKEDRLVTGSVPKQEEITPPKADTKATPKVAKKKKISRRHGEDGPEIFLRCLQVRRARSKNVSVRAVRSSADEIWGPVFRPSFLL